MEHFGSLLPTESDSDFGRSELCARDHIGSAGSPTSSGPHPCLEEKDPCKARYQGLVAWKSIGWGTISSLRLRGYLEAAGVIRSLGGKAAAWVGMDRVGRGGPGCRHFSTPRLLRLLSGDFVASGFVKMFVYCALFLRDRTLIKRSRRVRRTLTSLDFPPPGEESCPRPGNS